MSASPFAAPIPPAPPMSVSPAYIGVPIPSSTPVGLSPPAVAIVPDVVVASRTCSCSAVQVPNLLLRSRDAGEVVQVSTPANNRLPCVCLPITAVTVDVFCHLFSSFSAKTFRESTQLRGFLYTLLLLTCPLSSGGPEVLRELFRCQFNVKNRLPLSAFRLLSSLLP